MEGQRIPFGGHTISPELAQVAAILQRLIEHQEGKSLAAVVLQELVRLPLEDRVHREMLPAGCDARVSNEGGFGWEKRRIKTAVSQQSRITSLTKGAIYGKVRQKAQTGSALFLLDFMVKEAQSSVERPGLSARKGACDMTDGL